jgi:UrcA family protein
MMATPKPIIALAAMISGLAFTAPAFADARTVEVRTNDLDLSSPAGVARLDKRINNAIRQVCVSRIARTPGERQEVEKCEADARADAAVKMSQRIAQYRGTRIARAKLASD